MPKCSSCHCGLINRNGHYHHEATEMLPRIIHCKCVRSKASGMTPLTRSRGRGAILSRPTGEGGRRPGEGRCVVHPKDSAVSGLSQLFSSATWGRLITPLRILTKRILASPATSSPIADLNRVRGSSSRLAPGREFDQPGGPCRNCPNCLPPEISRWDRPRSTAGGHVIRESIRGDSKRSIRSAIRPGTRTP